MSRIKAFFLALLVGSLMVLALLLLGRQSANGLAVSVETPVPTAESYVPLILHNHHRPLATPSVTLSATATSTSTIPVDTVTPTASTTPSPTERTATVPTSTPTVTSTPTSTPTRAPTGTTSVLPFGAQIWQITDEAVLDLAQQAGIRWARYDIYWRGSEPTPGQYHWGSSDRAFTNAGKSSLEMIATFMFAPDWALENPDSYMCGPFDQEDLNAFADFVRAMVERYDGDGVDDYVDPETGIHPVVKYWEFYNEPDETDTSKTNIGCWGNYPNRYAEMLSYAYPAAKAANPEAKVVFGSPAYENYATFRNPHESPNWLDEVLNAGASMPGFDFDVMSFHQYDHFRDRWDGTSPYEQGIAGKAARIRQKLASHGLSKPLINTEVGLHVCGPSWLTQPQRLDAQAQHLVREYVRGMAHGLGAIIWYDMVDDATPGCPPPLYGLLRRDPWLDPRPAYSAYQTLTEELDGYTFDTQLDVTSGTAHPEYVQAYRFDKDGHKKLVVYRDRGDRIASQIRDDSDPTESMDISSTQLGAWTGRIHVIDKLGGAACGGDPVIEDGSVCDQDGTQNGSVKVTFSSDPLFIEVTP